MALSPTGRSWEGSSGSRLAEGRDSSQPQLGAHQLSRECSYAGEVQVTPTRPSMWIPGQRGQGSAPGTPPPPAPAPAAPLDAPTSGGKARPCSDEVTDAPDPLLPNVPPGLVTWGDFMGVSQDQICCPWRCARPKDSNHAGQRGSAI